MTAKSLPHGPKPQPPRAQAQDCFSCRNKVNCWAPKIKDEHIVLNLLVCRLKRGIEIEKTTKNILSMLRPKLKLLAKKASEDTLIDQDIALADLESSAIEYLQQHYLMGEVAYPLHYLFGMPNGVLHHYAANYARKQRAYEDTYRVGSLGKNIGHRTGFDDTAYQSESQFYDPREDEDPETDQTKMAREVMDDGVTLSLQEYRIFNFCLKNATDGNRPMSGLHMYLSAGMGIPRSKITKIYAEAARKIVAATNKALK